MALKLQIFSGPTTGRESDRRLFLWAGLLTVVIVLAGFSRSYFFKGFFRAPPLSLFLHVHAVVMTTWIVLFALQIGLIAAHHTTWHRRLGFWGIGLAALVVIMGLSATLIAAAREVRAHADFANFQLSILALEATQLALFSGFFVAAILRRKVLADHKRLMLLAIFAMIPNPIVRIPEQTLSPIANIEIQSALTVAFFLIDTCWNRRFQPTFVWGAAVLAVSMHFASLLGASAGWLSFSTWLVE